LNGKQARALRKIAAEYAEDPAETTNINVQVRTRESGKRVQNDDGVWVNEQVPVVTYTQVHLNGTARQQYKGIKKAYKRG